MKLVRDVRECRRWFSMWGLALIAVLGGLWEFIPALQQYLPPGWVSVLAVASALGRVIDQSRK